AAPGDRRAGAQRGNEPGAAGRLRVPRVTGRGSMASGRVVTLPSPALVETAAESYPVTCATRLGEVDQATWDALVPRDSPHMRYGFLRAVEASGLGRQPHYLRAWDGSRLVG